MDRTTAFALAFVATIVVLQGRTIKKVVDAHNKNVIVLRNILQKETDKEFIDIINRMED